LGHEDQFLHPRLSGGYRLVEPTFAGTGGKEEDAPFSAVRVMAMKPRGRDPQQPLAPIASDGP
jgi:hypothetical protein